MAKKDDQQSDQSPLDRAIAEEIQRERERSRRLRELEERRRRGEE